jgi:hypothetical protein
MNNILKNIYLLSRDSLMFIIFLVKLIVFKSFNNPIKKDNSGSVTVLANGPSLKEIIPFLTSEEEFKNNDFVVMNFFAFDDVFFQIKPKHYCFVDPMFFYENHQIENVKKLFTILEDKVDWHMNIYIPKISKYRNFNAFSGITNKNINILRINVINYEGYEYFRNFFYKKGLATPFMAGVAILAIYIALNSGYSKINVYGVDHNYFDNLCINESNELCGKETHFYDKEVVLLKPMLRSDNSKVWKVSDFILEKWTLFKSHDLLADYAKYLNAVIINCTKRSMIDSYYRKLYK